MIKTPNKVIFGSHPPQVFLKQSDGTYIEEALKELIHYDALEMLIDVAFSEGVAVVMIHQPDIERSLH